MRYNLPHVTRTQLLYTSVDTECSSYIKTAIFVFGTMYNYSYCMLTVYAETQSQTLVVVASAGWSLCGVLLLLVLILVFYVWYVYIIVM